MMMMMMMPRVVVTVVKLSVLVLVVVMGLVAVHRSVVAGAARGRPHLCFYLISLSHSLSIARALCPGVKMRSG